MPEQAAKAFRVQLREPGKRRVDEFCANRQLGILAYRGTAIPGADILANVAAKDLTTHVGTERLSNGAALFYGQVRDTQARIHLVGSNQGAGRAGIDASRAAAAAIFRHPKGHRRRQLQRGENHTQKEPGSELLIEYAGVLSDPANAGVLGVNALDQGAGIHVAAGLKGAERPLQALFQLLQATKQNVVVIGRLPGIACPGVAGDPAGFGRGGIDGSGRVGVVIGGANNDGARPRHGNTQRRAQRAVSLVAALQVLHLAGIAALDPGLEVAELGGLLARRRNGGDARA